MCVLILFQLVSSSAHTADQSVTSVLLAQYGVVHILSNQPRERGFPNDYASVILVQ